MSAVPLSYGAYKRTFSPQAVLENCFVEKAPTQQSTPLQIRARAGQSAFKAVGSAPIRGIFAKDGLFSDQVIIVDLNTVYLVDDTGAITTLAGTVGGSGRVQIDAGQDSDLNSIARIATGEGLYLVSGTTVTKEDFPTGGGPGCAGICEHRGFWFGIETGTQQVFYQVPGDTSWDALSFASAEYSPDPLVVIASRGDQIALGGSSTTEIWTLSGQASPAIQPYGGLNFDFGVRARDSMVNVAGALIWVDHNCSVRMFEGADASIISDNGIAEQIRLTDPEDIRATGFIKDQHTFYQLTLGQVATWVYDLSTQEWHTRTSLGKPILTGHLTASIGDKVFVADAYTNQISLVDPTLFQDNGTNFATTFSAYAELLEGTLDVANVEVSCDVGNAPRTGQGSDPVIVMRFSGDEGKTWSPWYDRPLGQTGETLTRVRWTALGSIKAPRGGIFQFRVTDPVGRRFSSLQMNAP